MRCGESFRLPSGLQTNRQRLLEDADLAEVPQGLPGHVAWKIDRAVPVVQLDAADVAALEPDLVGDRADDG